jgi:hypothetical protein
MAKTILHEAATLVALALFVAMLTVWAVVLS